MPTREYDSAHFSSIPAAQRAMAEDAAEDERLRQEAWRRQREHDLRLGREATARLWEAQRDGSRAWSSERARVPRKRSRRRARRSRPDSSRMPWRLPLAFRPSSAFSSLLKLSSPLTC